MHNMRSALSGLLIPSFFFREYSLADKFNLWRAKAKSGVSVILNGILATDLSQKITRLDMPFYVFHGAMDYTVSYALSKAYFEQAQAPVKGFYTFARSAHSPLFEEPQKLGQIIVGHVLKRKNGLGDKQEPRSCTAKRNDETEGR